MLLGVAVSPCAPRRPPRTVRAASSTSCHHKSIIMIIMIIVAIIIIIIEILLEIIIIIIIIIMIIVRIILIVVLLLPPPHTRDGAAPHLLHATAVARARSLHAVTLLAPFARVLRSVIGPTPTVLRSYILRSYSFWTITVWPNGDRGIEDYSLILAAIHCRAMVCTVSFQNVMLVFAA